MREITWRVLVQLAVVTGVLGSVAAEPDFAGDVHNLTIPVGRDAVFVCTVSSLGGYKVGWVKADNKAIQAIHTHVVTHNPRVSVTHSGPHIWNLHISNVKQEDAGTYMCQINTDPMKSQVAHLEVTVPPDIIDTETPSEVSVSEGEAVKLSCKAQGQPQPKITWRREDGRDLIDFNFKEEKGQRQYSKADFLDGDLIKWQAVTRHQMGAYFCIANNGVPPSVSKRIMVSVTFPPSVRVRSQLIGVPAKSTVSLECEVESSPKPITFWTKDGEIAVANQRIIVNETKVSNYRFILSLKILDFFPTADAGKYECHAKNVVGEANGTISLYEIIVPRTDPPTTTTIQPRTRTTATPRTIPSAPRLIETPNPTKSLQIRKDAEERPTNPPETNIWSQLLPKQHNDGVQIRSAYWIPSLIMLLLALVVYL